jgi:transcriptional regulator with XRE-family HTH domain
LALDAEMSPRYLSFLETGRSEPTRETVLHLADRLGVPLRERNLILDVAGFPPTYQERGLSDPEFQVARRSIDLILGVHLPNPALAVDRHWTVLAANPAVDVLTAGIDPILINDSMNFVRLCLHPAGLAPRILNLGEWRRYLVGRLRQQIEVTGDPILVDLVEEVRDYPVPSGLGGRKPPVDHELLAVPFRMASVHGILSFFCTTTVFAAPVDITLAELAVESLFPADASTAKIMRRVEADRTLCEDIEGQQAAAG